MERCFMNHEPYPFSYDELLEKYCTVCKERDELKATVRRVKAYLEQLKEAVEHE